MKKISVIILVAGKSSRFKSKKSKVFHELAGLPIIDHIYFTAKKISNEIIFVCNKNNIKIFKKHFTDCKFAIQKKQNGTADAVLSAKKLIKSNSDILVLCGDVPLISLVSLKKLINNFYKKKLFGTMLAFNSKNPFSYGRVISEDNKVKKVIEEINATSKIKKITLCNSGVFLTKYEIIFSFIDKINASNKKKEKYLPDIFEICYRDKKSFVYSLCNEDEVIGINTLKDFIKVDEIYQEQLKQKLINKGVKILNPKTVRVSYDTKIGKDSVIEPYVILGKGVNIKEDVIIRSHTNIESAHISKGSSIGPYARIRPETFINQFVKIGNYVEIKNSKIGKNCSISHLSYIGDSKLGKNINIGAGTITCNYDGKKKYKTVIDDNVFIGSNSSLIAPLKISKNSQIGAGSVISKNIPKDSLALERSKMTILKKNKRK